MYVDGKYRALSRPPPNGQTLWVYLLTGEYTTILPGLLHVGEHALAEALEWPLPDLRSCWSEIERLSMAKADWHARVIWIPNRVRYGGNGARNPNMVGDICRVHARAGQGARRAPCPDCGTAAEGAKSPKSEAGPCTATVPRCLRERVPEADSRAF
jgi:hypothetical protein